jgi:hypothetical protein
VSITEGNSLTKQATFTLTLSAPATVPVTYNIATTNGTAVAPGDYVAKSLTGQSIPAGNTSATFAVTIRGDTTVEANETFLVNVTGVTGATLGDGQAIGTITNDDAAALRIARFDARGLYDDFDDGHREPVVTDTEYAQLLLNSAQRLCAATEVATIVAVAAVENARVLAELADIANATCVQGPRYTAVMSDPQAAEGTGFLITMPRAKEAFGAHVLGAPQFSGEADTTTLRVLPEGHAGPIALLAPEAPAAAPRERALQAKALARQVREQLQSEPGARVILIGEWTAPGLRDLTTRDQPRDAKATQRISLSPKLLEEFGQARVEFLLSTDKTAAPQVLHLQR